MAHNKDNDALITNAETLIRRAWIESAIECVRTRIEAPQPLAEFGDIAASVGCIDDRSEATGAHLTLVWSADERRSGT